MRSVSIRLGYQIPNFTYPGPATGIFPTVAAQARAAERSGFDTVFVMDHFYPLPLIGSPDEPMLEAYSTLAALAAVTTSIRLSALVTGNTYRNPALLAKTVTTVDVISGGRAVLGLGAGWYEFEHRAYGFEFGSLRERFERLGESLEIVVPMLRGERPSVDGRWYHTEDARNEPRLRNDLPVLIGGGGERRTFAFAARWADHLNILCAAREIPRKLAAVRARCAELGRDPASLDVSYLGYVMIDENGDRARDLHRQFLLARGIDLRRLTERESAAATDRHFVGTPAEVAEEFDHRVLRHGIDRLIVNLVTNGHEEGIVELTGRTLTDLLAGR
ncbi:putative oxidoreductase [Rhodococcus rhodochrous ATCC 21198]|nr:putative oxidoreductase [Rhodococcus rhodochrous ATCC 21198]